MAIYTNKVQPSVNDLYETPVKTLDMVLQLLDRKRHFLWEPFRGTGHSTRYMRSLGYTVTNGDHVNFFEQSVPVAPDGMETVLVSNPPFSVKRQIVARLESLGVHKVALLLPAPVLFTQYFRDYCQLHPVQLIVHTKRCAFLDPATGKPGKQPSFDVAWICVGPNLARDINFSL